MIVAAACIESCSRRFALSVRRRRPRDCADLRPGYRSFA